MKHVTKKYFKGGDWVGKKHEWNAQKLATPNNTVSTSHRASIVDPSLIGRTAASPTLTRSMLTLFVNMFVYMSSTYQSILCSSCKHSKPCLFHSPTMRSPLVGVDKRVRSGYSHPPSWISPCQSHDINIHMDIEIFVFILDPHIMFHITYSLTPTLESQSQDTGCTRGQSKAVRERDIE